jgi:hypothetical protein
MVRTYRPHSRWHRLTSITTSAGFGSSPEIQMNAGASLARGEVARRFAAERP